MAQKKKITPSENDVNPSDVIGSKTKHPLVFISHDTRDADLAEQFSSLLKNASAGALKSFRSSDKKGAQGIEYGQEWYPAIMDKIDEASDVVCLLTQHSVDRPWILYEAGVAKGKLDKKVIGIAIGIPLSTAITGPFAQFQNNDGDSDSITKLVLELVRKVPGLDPDPTLVKQLVDGFIVKAVEITEKYKNQILTTDKSDKEGENSVAKLFEEVKIMFDSLPSKIENRLDPEIRRRRRKFHPMMFEEIMHFGFVNEDPNIGFLMLL
ncbi:toll/interleukin-1 receptor domain-containing protein [Emticicia sp. BO119]|uniref:toll/interleukin-1 receptor domain-containing protein n=1 Tax=Emticicia sp. BO119 TaxID=2757768 RepID=UPI0015F035D3|nr:toll/interleukin-1 receptor domain-containing protein [Emticicia sp. BO119]MBA4852935.1 toll/interleukin-1 receptor domain-containing protein [Emticicia sp. BO119]